MSRPETPQTAATTHPANETGTETDHDGQACQGCGAHVSERYRRVFGTNEDVVHACPECASNTDIFNGAGAGVIEPGDKGFDEGGR